MIPFVLIRKVLVSFAPMIIFFLMKKVVKSHGLPTRKPRQSTIDKSMVVEGEIVEKEAK